MTERSFKLFRMKHIVSFFIRLKIKCMKKKSKAQRLRSFLEGIHVKQIGNACCSATKKSNVGNALTVIGCR